MTTKQFYLPALMVGLLMCTTAPEEAHPSPLGHAPIGVMADHTHNTDEVMLSYRFSKMAMKGSRDGTSQQTPQQVLGNYMVTPLEMDMEMHMFGAMYAPTDDLTLMAMLPYTRKVMGHATRNGGSFTTETEGFGDTSFGGLFKLYDEGADKLHFGAGLSIPTGAINERDRTPMGTPVLPYPMQLGTGTFDILPSLTYKHYQDSWSWGTQASARLPLGQNYRGYSVGESYQLTSWIAQRVHPSVSLSARLAGSHWTNYDGSDSSLNPNMIPTADANLRGGTRIDGLLGVNLHLPEWSGNRFAIEGGAPLYQHLDGPQLETDWRLTAGWQYSY